MLRRQIRVRLRSEHERRRLSNVELNREDTRYEQVGRVIQTARALLTVQEVEVPRGLGTERSVAAQNPERFCRVGGTNFDPIRDLEKTGSPAVAAAQAMKVAVCYQRPEL